MNDLLLFSGGLDSLIAYFYLEEPKALFLNMNQRYADVEIERVMRLDKKIGMNLIIEDKAFDFSHIEKDDLVIPNRNAFMSLWATNYADNIWLAAVDGDYNHDKNPSIFKDMGEFYSKLKARNVKVDSPFWHWTKTDMIRWFLKKGYPAEWLLDSYSCFSGLDKHCGRCTSCLRRWLAMFNNDIEEEYIENPLDWEVIPDYIKRMACGDQISDTEGRKREFFTAIFKAGYKVPNTNVEWIENLRKEYK